MKILSSRGRWDILCLFAGAALTLGFAPFEIFPLGIISPAILLAAWLNASPPRSFWRGFLFGIGFFATGVYWVFISIHQFGNAPAWLAAIITLVFILVLALFPALTGLTLNHFFKQPTNRKILLAFPALWVFSEWIRSWIFSGFPWLFLGYTQIDAPLKGYAPLLSVYGISLLTALSSALIVYAFLSYQKHAMRAVYFCLFGLAAIWSFGGMMSFIPWTKPDKTPLQVSLIQGNIAQSLKWDPAITQSTLDLYYNLTSKHWDSQVIIWPETAVPLTLQQGEDYLGMIFNESLRHHATVITGLPIQAPQGGFFNAVIALGEGSGLYVKQRLVPFGEFTPMVKFFGKFLDFFAIPMSDIIPGQENLTPIITHGVKLATFICYEIAFPEQVLRQDGTVGLLLTVTNDAWFGHSIAQSQHLEIARMRSLEMGRPGLLVSNNGITAFITSAGKIQSTAPPYQQAVLTDTIQPMQGKTPWVRFGLDPVLLILIIMLVLAKLGSTKRRKAMG